VKRYFQEGWNGRKEVAAMNLHLIVRELNCHGGKCRVSNHVEEDEEQIRYKALQAPY
jgi:hypothetical protein